MRLAITGRRHADRIRRVTIVGSVTAATPILVPTLALEAGWDERAVVEATMAATIVVAGVIATLLARLTRRIDTQQARFDSERRHWRDEANTDPLCGIANRRGAAEEFGRLLADAGPDDRWSVVVVDVDRFKDVNDTHGHAVGDRVLTAVAAELDRHAPDHAVVARWGGDEFVIVTCGPDVIDERSLERLVAAVAARPVACRAGSLRVTVCAGVADGPVGEPVEAVLARADGDLLDSKALRRRAEAAAVAATATTTSTTTSTGSAPSVVPVLELNRTGTTDHVAVPTP